MINIAIDGPAGAGKSYLARTVAARLGYIYVDTGALYRAIGLYMTRHGVLVSDASSVVDRLSEVSVSLDYAADGEQHVYLNGEDVSTDIRLPEISMAASAVSAIPEVRAFLLDIHAVEASNQDGRVDIS